MIYKKQQVKIWRKNKAKQKNEIAIRTSLISNAQQSETVTLGLPAEYY